MTVTFNQAQKLVQDQLDAPAPVIVADWGYENAKYWWMVVGLEQWLVDHDRDFCIVDDLITLVDKETGAIKETSYMAILPQLDSYTPVGPIPDFFKPDQE